jgi:hypothetical protein
MAPRTFGGAASLLASALYWIWVIGHYFGWFGRELFKTAVFDGVLHMMAPIFGNDLTKVLIIFGPPIGLAWLGIKLLRRGGDRLPASGNRASGFSLTDFGSMLPRVEPWHLMVVGLAIVVAGMIWQQQRGLTPDQVKKITTPLETQLSDARQQITTLRAELARPVSGPSAISPTPIPRAVPDSLRGPYLLTLAHISGVLNKQVRPVFDEAARIAQAVGNPIAAPNYVEARDKLKGYYETLNGAYDDIYRHTIPEANELVADRLKYVVDFDVIERTPIYILSQKISTLNGGIYQMINLATKSEGKINELEIASLLRADAQNVLDTIEKTKRWVAQCNERIKQE